MKILGIDTSTKYLSLAIVNDDNVLACFHEHEGMRHSSLLLPMMDKILRKCSLKLNDIEAIALSIGPGSFTGLRIGVATCKGINLALGTPVIAVPTLDAVAYNFINEKERILAPMLDAKKGKIYACFYEKPNVHLVGGNWIELKRLTDYMLIDIGVFLKKVNKPTLVFGDGIELYGNDCKKNPYVRISAKEWFPKAEIVARLGLRMAVKRQFTNPDKLVPMYLHSKYCQVKVKQ